MSYKGERLTNQLREARELAGLSQRALSSASGLTQSHISQIERGAIEPGLASLIDIARALELELVLVPKKLLPAVDSILGQTPAKQMTPVHKSVRAEIARGERLLTKQEILYGSSADLDRIRNALIVLRSHPLEASDLAQLRDALQRIHHIQTSKQSRETIKAIADAIQNLRNHIVHTPAPSLRPAYSLEDAEDA